MHNTFLVETLRLLDQADLESFRLFVYSEFHNKGKSRAEILRLFDHLMPLHPDFDDEAIKKSVVYPIVFPNTPEFAGKLEKLIGELYRLLKDFLLWKQYQSNETQFERALDWAKVLRKLKDNLNYESALTRLEKDFFAKTAQAPSTYFQRFRLELERHEWVSQMNKGRDDLNLNKTLTSLFVFYESYRLELLNYLLQQQKLVQIDISPVVAEYMDTGIHTGLEHSSYVVLDISNKIYQLLKQPIPQQSDFEVLMDMLTRNEDELTPEVLKSYFAYLRNICAIMINAGHLELHNMLFLLLKDNIQRGYLYLDGKLHTTTLANLTRAAVFTNNVDWALECIESHKNKMFGDVETLDYYHVNKACCLFEKRAYGEALELLPPSSPNITYHLIARRMELMCYYELKSELLFSKMEAFKVYIWRASEKFLSDALRDSNKAFINFLIQLVSIPQGDKKKLERLEKRILEKKYTAEMRWLLAKVQQ